MSSGGLDLAGIGGTVTASSFVDYDLTVCRTDTDGTFTVQIEGHYELPAEEFFTVVRILDGSGSPLMDHDVRDAVTAVVGDPLTSLERSWTWQSADFFEGTVGQSITVRFLGGEQEAPVCTGKPFTGRITWPYLDMGAPGSDKDLEGFDVVADGTLSVRIGFDQKRQGLSTAAHEMEGDNLPGNMVPVPLSAPSMQMRITFEGGQDWEWFSTNIYVSDTGKS